MIANNQSICFRCNDLSHLFHVCALGIINTFLFSSCIFYFEEGNPHFLEVSEDEVDAYLPEKVDE